MGNEQFGPSIKMHERPSSFNQMEDIAASCILLHAPCNMVHPCATWSKHFIASCLQQNARCNMLVAYPKMPQVAKSFSQAHLIEVTLAVKSSIQIYIRACNNKNPSNS
jgi:hypothetical protein